MSKFIVKGGKTLLGEIEINGAKNAALPILCASILNKGITVLNNVPNLSDTKTAIDILKCLGCKVTRHKKTVVIDSSVLTSCKIPIDLMQKMRSSIIFLGALISRMGEAQMVYPGGCCLGSRPINLHIKALKKLGIEISEENDTINAKAKNVIGNEIYLDFPSVGATQNSILASVSAYGKTIVKNAAKEPEIADLCCFLNKMGANISGAGTDKITINGVDLLNDCEYCIMPDRIEAGTYMCAAAATGGNIFLKNINFEHLRSLIEILINGGCDILEFKDKLLIKAPKRLIGIENIETGPYPLFPTDMQAQLMAVLATAQGNSSIKENIFEARNKHAFELNKMGADISVKNGNEFFIKGVPKLSNLSVSAYDLRGGAAMIIAALGGEGESVISGAEHILRGYENIKDVINSVGGDMDFII